MLKCTGIVSYGYIRLMTHLHIREHNPKGANNMAINNASNSSVPLHAIARFANSEHGTSLAEWKKDQERKEKIRRQHRTQARLALSLLRPDESDPLRPTGKNKRFHTLITRVAEAVITNYPNAEQRVEGEGKVVGKTRVAQDMTLEQISVSAPHVALLIVDSDGNPIPNSPVEQGLRLGTSLLKQASDRLQQSRNGSRPAAKKESATA